MSAKSRASEQPLRDGAASAGASGAETGFETTLARLNVIVEELESGELGLESSLSLFEEGVRLARAAQVRLDRAEKRLEELIRVDENGEPLTRELDPE